MSNAANELTERSGIPTAPPPPPLQTAQPFPAYAQPQKNAVGRRRGRFGYGLVLVLLLIVILLGTVGYFAVRFVGSHFANGPATNPDVQVPVITTPINTTVTYASVAITIINAQQATSFPNESQATGVLRLNLHEQNTNTTNSSLVPSTASYAYADAFRLLLPGGKIVAPVDSQSASGPIEGQAQTGWVDFPVPTTTKVNQLIVRLGTAQEAQMDIPLTSHADVSKYQPRQVSPNAQVNYAGLLVTLSTASAQFSYGGQQANSGTRFIVVSLTIANPTSSDVHANPPDYLRLQSGTTTIAPEGSTSIPIDIAANTTNTTGTAAFLVPQNETAFTLILLAGTSTGASSQATIAFQIQ